MRLVAMQGLAEAARFLRALADELEALWRISILSDESVRLRRAL
jgi:hypothetical protein